MLVNVVYPPSCPTERPAGCQDDALVHLSQFHSGRTSARLKNLATHYIRANALSFLQCRNHTFSSRCGHQLYKYRVGRCFTARDSSGSRRDCREGLVLFAYFAKVLYESPEDPCEVFLPSEFTFGVTCGHCAVFLANWQSDCILFSPCQRSRQTLRLLGVPLQECWIVGDEGGFSPFA